MVVGTGSIDVRDVLEFACQFPDEVVVAEPAEKRWTVDEFLAWDDGTDRRYELVDGQVVAMAPPSETHGTIVANLTVRSGSQLRAPCRVVGEAGVTAAERSDTYYQADLLVTCAAPDAGTPVSPGPDPDRGGALALDRGARSGS